ncbi:hypothetical protein J2S43_005999 [Catenuloplanes nepalensis]|uniref:Uncharacterized protein n=1 Tax=Catenuloplanes nepalensis TaxID=587533 RepID=A0ABT9N1A5_9ACTN|nr:hypothetical protein [Catenuloplanes nepalensis]MDP9797487.1 hypothetical protein [Catenuloplanes nepalensis]
MESCDGVELLLDVGLDRRVAGSSEVEISAGGDLWSRHRVLLLRHSPSPTEIERALASLGHVDGLLFVVARAGRALTAAAERDHRIAYAAVDDDAVYFRGHLHRGTAARPSAPIRPARTSWARAAILRLFALGTPDPLTQSEIARRIGVSHVAVAKQLPFLDGLIERTAAGWRAVDRAGCWDRFVGGYPGPRGLATHWAATQELMEQITIVEAAADGRGDAVPAVSGDLAADFYAPWRRPSRAVAYVAVQLDLAEHGFATVPAANATMTLCIPADPTVLAMSREWPLRNAGRIRRYTDPLITAWDLSRSSGGDVAESVGQLRSTVLRESQWASGAG